MNDIANFACTGTDSAARLVGKEAIVSAKQIGLSSKGFFNAIQALLYFHIKLTPRRSVSLWTDILSMRDSLPVHVRSVEIDGLGVTELMKLCDFVRWISAGRSLLVLTLRRIFLSPSISTLLSTITVLFSEIRMEGCVYSDADYLAAFANPTVRIISLGMEDQCVCHSQLIDEPIAQQLPPANRDSVRLISMSYRLEKGSSYLMQSPAVQAYFSSRVSHLTTLFFRGDFDVFLFVQGIIHSSGSTLEKLDVMLYNCESNHS